MVASRSSSSPNASVPSPSFRRGFIPLWFRKILRQNPQHGWKLARGGNWFAEKPTWVDHWGELLVDGKSWLVAHPYSLGGQHLHDLAAFASSTNCKLLIDGRSDYAPGATFRILIGPPNGVDSSTPAASSASDDSSFFASDAIDPRCLAQPIESFNPGVIPAWLIDFLHRNPQRNWTVGRNGVFAKTPFWCVNYGTHIEDGRKIFVAEPESVGPIAADEFFDLVEIMRCKIAIRTITKNGPLVRLRLSFHPPTTDENEIGIDFGTCTSARRF